LLQQKIFLSGFIYPKGKFLMRIPQKQLQNFKSTFLFAAKNVFNFKLLFSSFKHSSLERSPMTDVFINKYPYFAGIKSKTFQKFLTPEFIPSEHFTDAGLCITTIMDKKTQKPVRAYVAKFEKEDPSLDGYVIMIKDKNGDIEAGNEKYKIVGKTHFFVNKDAQMVTPKTGTVLIENEFGEKEFCEKLDSYMTAAGNKDYSGIGIRLHQLRVERMLQEKLGNVCIAADGNSFPFHYNMGYRFEPKYTQLDEDGIISVVNTLCKYNKKQPIENMKFVTVEDEYGKQLINISHSIENCLFDYYKHGGNPIVNFVPYMYLDDTSVHQWINLVKASPILLKL
jgi:hypothetical protein